MVSPLLHRAYAVLPLFAQSWVVAAAGYRSYRHRFGPAFPAALADLLARDCASADAMQADQDYRIRATVQAAARDVPYYRDLFRRAGIDPAAIRGSADLPRIPLLDKETVRRVGAELCSAATPPRHRIAARTSGSTGTALPLWHSRDGLAAESAAAWRQRAWYGLALGDPFAAFGGQQVVPRDQTKPPYWRHDPARRRTLFSLHHLAPRYLAAYGAQLARPGNAFWQGYPSSIALVCDALLEHGIELGRAAPRAVFTSSETLLDSQRATIERATLAPVADRYANTELCVSVSQCPAGSYHIDTERCAIEIDPWYETPDGVHGEIIATGLAHAAMPLLRYRTGDAATLLRGGACACGRSRPRIANLTGRIDDAVVTADGRRIGRLDAVFKDALSIREAQVIQTARTVLRVRYVPRPSCDAAALARLVAALHGQVGADMHIELEAVACIPRDANGKFRAVVSRLGQGEAPRGLS